MTATTPVEKVVEVLVSANYRRIETPLSLAGVKFDFPAAFIGGERSNDLILVADTAFDSPQRIQQKVEGVARALDVMESKRPLTIVLVGPRPRAPVLDAMTRVCRVLPVGVVPDVDQDASIHNWLAVLLPLDLPQPREDLADPIAELVPPGGADNPIIQVLLAASILGQRGVEEALQQLVSEPLAAIEPEDGG